jgi:5-dehydro-2-deoxygluconokinase
MFWRSVDEARRQQLRALEYATVAIGNREEIAVAVGEGGPEHHAQRLLDLGVQIAIVKMGPAGVLVATADGVERVPPVPIEVVNGLGAGDAFGGAVCHGLLSGWSPGETVAFANAAGAYVAGQLACADAMPTEEQVRALMASAAA